MDVRLAPRFTLVRYSRRGENVFEYPVEFLANVLLKRWEQPDVYEVQLTALERW